MVCSFTEAATVGAPGNLKKRCSSKVFQNSQKNTFSGLFFNKVAGTSMSMLMQVEGDEQITKVEKVESSVIRTLSVKEEGTKNDKINERQMHVFPFRWLF